MADGDVDPAGSEVADPGSVAAQRPRAAHNLSLDAFRLLAALFVVFIHFPLPDRLDYLGDGIGRAAVPFFFAASGYFAQPIVYSPSWGVVRRRYVKLARMFAWASVLYLAWTAYRMETQGDSFSQWLVELTSPKGLAGFLFFNETAWGAHLWFIPALIYCTVAFKLLSILGLTRTELLTALAMVLLIVQAALGEFSSAIPASQQHVLRNWVFVGLPFYLIGYVMSVKLTPSFRSSGWRLWALAAFVGALLSVIEQLAYGIQDLYVGSIVVAVSLMMISVAVPRPASRLVRIAARWGGRYSGNIYILHVVVGGLLIMFAIPVVGKSEMTQAALPFAAFGLSLVAAMAIYHGRRLVRSLRRGAA